MNKIDSRDSFNRYEFSDIPSLPQVKVKLEKEKDGRTECCRLGHFQ